MSTLVCIDVVRAFDRVWQEELIVKMNDFEYATNNVHLADSYLRRKYVKQGPNMSNFQAQL